MDSLVKIENIENKIIEFNGINIIIDHDVADIYNVETKRINEAVKNNPNKFPEGYIIQLTENEWQSLRSNFSTLKKLGRGKHTKFTPKAFTEKGLYMLATILKSATATETTINIIETFSKVRELRNTVTKLTVNPPKQEQQSLMQRSGEIMAELLGENLQKDETETTIELNFAVLKFKHTVKKKKKEL